MYTPGDLIIQKKDGEERYGEVVGVNPEGQVEVCFIHVTPKQEGRVWEFNETNEWEAIDASTISKHVKVPEESDRKTTVKAWADIGFLPGGDGMSFCRLEHENTTTLPLYEGAEDDSGDEEEETASSNPKMHGYASDGFVVPDDEGSDFEFADPDQLDEEAAKFVRETHEAVREFDKWTPKDKQGHAVKQFIERMDYKATIETDNKRFEKGKPSISTSKPPLSKKRRRQ
jgi:hypothetical protein